MGVREAVRVLFISSVVLPPLACDRDRDNTLDEVRHEIKDTGDEIKDRTEDAGEEIEDKMDRAGDKIEI